MRFIVSTAFALLMMSGTAQAKFMPDNDLHLEKATGGISEAEFNEVIDRASEIYTPIFSQFGATLTIRRLWSDDTVNASAEQPSANNWRVNMYGGLARRPEVTADGFAMVLCHEIGHHTGGHPYVQAWAANEGQSDIFATGACAYKIFAADPQLTAKAREELPAEMKAKCDAAHPVEDRDVCYRILLAGKSLATLLANGGEVSFLTPDTNVVSRTNHRHPAAQCRLDTYVAGALCGRSLWNDALIPGKGMSNRNSFEAQQEAFAHSCVDGEGARPSCWFAAIDENGPPASECPIQDPAMCELLCQLDPTQPWCTK